MAARTRRGLPCSHMMAGKGVDVAAEENEDCEVDVDRREPQEEAALARLASGSSDTALRIVRYKGTSSITLPLLRAKNTSKSSSFAADQMECRGNVQNQ